MNRLNVLLGAWLICALAPALVLETGAFGHIGTNTDLNGPAIGFWLGGYLVQFGIFFWISRIAEKGAFGGWFVASILPWGIDWTLPVSPWFALPWIAIGLATAVYIGRASARSESLHKDGVRATGVVLQVYEPAMNVVVNNVYIKRKMRVRIERADKTPPYEGTFDGLFMMGEIPSAGDRIPLIVDPNDPQHFEYDGDGAAGAALPQSPATRTHAGGGVADQLSELADLHQRGDLNDTEFAAAKGKLLDRP